VSDPYLLRSDKHTRPNLLGCQIQGAWVWQPCASILWTKTQSTVFFSPWIFQALKAWDGANVVFSHKVKLSFCPLVEKIEALVVGVFQYFCPFTLFFVYCFCNHGGNFDILILFYYSDPRRLDLCLDLA
jgi:hypothetical protein